MGAANMPDVQPSALGAVAMTADTSVTETQTSAPPRHQRRILPLPAHVNTSISRASGKDMSFP